MGGYKQQITHARMRPLQRSCVLISPRGGLSFQYPGESPHQQWLHKLHPAFSLLPWASVLSRLCSHVSAWEHMHTHAPSVLLHSDCAVIQGGSARQGQKQQDGQHKPEHGGVWAVLQLFLSMCVGL